QRRRTPAGSPTKNGFAAISRRDYGRRYAGRTSEGDITSRLMLWLLLRKGVALLRIPALQAPGKPADALRRTAMGEGVRHDITLASALKAIVANGAGGVQAFLDVALFQRIALTMRMVRPHPRQTIGLQLHPHADLIRHRLIHLPP